MTLYLCTKTVTISSRGPHNLLNFLFQGQKCVIQYKEWLTDAVDKTVAHGNRYLTRGGKEDVLSITIF